MSEILLSTNSAIPNTPAANSIAIYTKPDGLLYIKDSTGIETVLGGGVQGLGTASTKNVAINGNAALGEVVLGNDTRLIVGTAATKNVAVNGNAAPGEVVLGNDTRLTNSGSSGSGSSGSIGISQQVAGINPDTLVLTGVYEFSAIGSATMPNIPNLGDVFLEVKRSLKANVIDTIQILSDQVNGLQFIRHSNGGNGTIGNGEVWSNWRHIVSLGTTPGGVVPITPVGGLSLGGDNTYAPYTTRGFVYNGKLYVPETTVLHVYDLLTQVWTRNVGALILSYPNVVVMNGNILHRIRADGVYNADSKVIGAPSTADTIVNTGFIGSVYHYTKLTDTLVTWFTGFNPTVAQKYVLVGTVWTNSVYNTDTNRPVFRKNAAFAYSGNLMYMFGGSTAGFGTLFADFYVYNATTEAWANITPVGTTPPAGVYRMEIIGGMVYLLGRQTSNAPPLGDAQLWLYDPTTNAWTDHSATLVGYSFPGDLFWTAASIDTLYWGGGRINGGSSNVKTFQFSLAAAPAVPISSATSWANKSQAIPSTDVSMVVLPSGLIYELGVSPNGITNMLSSYDPATDIWLTSLPITMQLLTGAMCVSSGNLIYIYQTNKVAIGGIGTFMSFDPVTNTTITLTPPAGFSNSLQITTLVAYLLEDLGMVEVVGVIYMLLPQIDPAYGYDKVALMSYTIATDTWATEIITTIPLYQIAGTRLLSIGTDLYFLNTGGFTRYSTVYSNTIALPNATTHSQAQQIGILNGNIYIFGGKTVLRTATTSYAIVQSLSHHAEMYDVALNVWLATAAPVPDVVDPAYTVVGNKLYVHGGLGIGLGLDASIMRVFTP